MKQNIQHQKERKTTKALVFIFSLLLPLGMLCACSNSEDDAQPTNQQTNTKETVLPVLEGGDYMIASQFFATELHNESESNPSSAFFTDQQESVCYAVNSKEELKRLYQGEKALPEINYSNYTLIIGVEKLSHLLYKLEKQELVTESGKAQLNLYVSEPEDKYYPAMIKNLYYWGLYPKMEGKTFTVKTVKIE